MSLKGARLIDFTGAVSGFEHYAQFGDSVVKLLRNGSENKVVVVIDRALHTTEPHLVADHVNLSGTNPLCGPNVECGERFPVVNGVYLTEFGDDVLTRLPRGVAGGLKAGVSVSEEERAKLSALGIDFYCYNLVNTMLVAAHAGWKVVAIVVPDGTRIGDKVAARLRGE